jgi:Na(+)-translocating NADH:ubiquinone oxidoreductase F subunit
MNKDLARPLRLSDYSLTGQDTALAIEKGLAEATWYTSPVPKAKMRELLERRDAPAFWGIVLWVGLIVGAALWAYQAWGTWWAIPAFALYGVLYASTSDARWHEMGHGTAFKTDWMNNVVYEVASFMVLRNATVWRWSHTRHHSDTIIVGRDPEIAVPRPPDMVAVLGAFINLKAYPKYIRTTLTHITGRLTAEELTYIPEFEHNKVVLRARIYTAIYASVIALALYLQSPLPVLYIGLPNLYGAWLMAVYGYTQHAGLAENVLDHRLNCRTVYMNPLNRFLYLNMNYHVEHHMFPLVPYYNLPKLHEIVKPDMPTPYNGLWEAYREIIPALLRQIKEPGWFVKRKLPTPTFPADAASQSAAITAEGKPVIGGWVEVCDSAQLLKSDVVRFDHNHRTYAIYRTAEGKLYATDGLCTHGNAHLADGMVKGHIVECAKHNGRFDLRDGQPARLPVCVALRTHAVRESASGGRSKIFFHLKSADEYGVHEPPTRTFRVVSNHNVATFIKELVLEPIGDTGPLKYQPGDYLQIDIPAYAEKNFHTLDIDSPFAQVWQMHHVYDFTASNPIPCRRNYSFATNPATDSDLRFNVRIATPPRGQEAPAGVGSTYVFSLQPGDTVTAIGPFGEFHVQESERELVYIGGGAGMAPLRSHLSYLLETKHDLRPISYWYGARSRQEIFYQDYFEGLAARHPNFNFHIALSEPQPTDHWTSHLGFIHEVVKEQYLAQHPDPTAVAYFLCGPPGMVQAATKMLKSLGVPAEQIAFDEF